MRSLSLVALVFVIGCDSPGPKGDPGPSGPEGPSGISGAAGPTGVSGSVDPNQVILNGTTQQTASFNVSGNAVVGGSVGVGVVGTGAKLHVNGVGSVISQAFNVRETARFSKAAAVTNMGIVFDTDPPAGPDVVRGLAIEHQTAHFGVVRYDSASVEAPTYDLTVDENGQVGVGVMRPASRLHVQGGDVYLSDAGRGIILKSPDGTKCARISLNNGGTLETNAITCP